MDILQTLVTVLVKFPPRVWERGEFVWGPVVAPAVLWTGLKWALAIGFIGGLYPALRAARLPVTTALREL